MSGELNIIIAEKLGTLGNNNLYRMKIIESLFVHSENVYRRYQHIECDYGKHIELRSNNLCNTIYSSIKLICDKNSFSFPFLLSYFHGKDIFKIIKDELIDSLIHGKYENPQLRPNVRCYLQSDKNIQDRNDFLYNMYFDYQVIYKEKVSTIIESRIKDYVTELTTKEIQQIYKKVSDKVKNFDRDKNKKRTCQLIMTSGFIYGFVSSLFFIGNVKLNRMFSFTQIFAIVVTPFLALTILGKLLNCRRLYNINDDFRDLNISSVISSEMLDRDQISSNIYGSFV